MPKHRILSLDGGGVRGVVTAVLLARLQQKFPALLDGVDLMAGTSTGGLIALGLRRGLTPLQLRDLYLRRSVEIFADDWLDDLRDLGRLRGAEYGNASRERVFRDVLGDTTTLADLQGAVMVTAFDLDNEADEAGGGVRCWKPKILHNVRGTDSDGAVLAWKAALYTSSAPTYFPSSDGMIDGGVYANNPAMCALAQSLDRRSARTAPLLTDVRLLSLGTGTPRLYVGGSRHDWGYAQWAPRLVDMMIDGVVGVADFQCRALLGEQYCRFAPYFPPERRVATDDLRQLAWLDQWAEALDLAALEQWVERQWL